MVRKHLQQSFHLPNVQRCPVECKRRREKNKGEEVENKKSMEDGKRETVKHKGNWTRKEK
jgi:hypothetical protein